MNLTVHHVGDITTIEKLFPMTFFFNFIFKLYIIVLVLPNIKMNPPQVSVNSLTILSGMYSEDKKNYKSNFKDHKLF